MKESLIVPPVSNAIALKECSFFSISKVSFSFSLFILDFFFSFFILDSFSFFSALIFLISLLVTVDIFVHPNNNN